MRTDGSARSWRLGRQSVVLIVHRHRTDRIQFRYVERKVQY